MAYKKINQLQFLRFIAFSLIFLYHAGVYTNLPFCGKLNPGLWAVSYFIILSGFLTTIKYYDNVSELKPDSIFKYLKQKVSKVYHLYFILTIISISLYNFPEIITSNNYKSIIGVVFQLIKNLLLIQSWFPNGYFSFVGVGWFLSTIIFLYFLSFPFIIFIKKINKSNKNFITILLILVILLFEIFYAFCLRNTEQSYYNYVIPFSRTFEYLIGMLVGCIYKNSIIKKEVSVRKRLFNTLLEALAIVIITFVMIIDQNVVWLDRISKWIIPNSILIYIIALGKGYLSKIFSKRTPTILGDISSKAFLINPIILLIYFRLYGSTSIIGNLFSLVYIYVLTLVLSYAIYSNQTKR